jgi:hypothetical protein
MEEEDQVEDITALTAPHVSATVRVVSNATPLPSIVGKETLDGCHVAEVAPPSPPPTFHVVAKAPPPLAPLVPRFPHDSQLAAQLALDFAKIGDHIGVIPGPNEHEVQVTPPRAPFLATNRAGCSEKQKLKKKDAKLKKRKDRE